MTELPPDAEAAIAAMTEAEFDLLIARTRSPEEPPDPMVRAANALRRSRGIAGRTRKATPEEAADALRRYSTGKDETR